MELLTVLKEMDNNNMIVWKGENYKLLTKYLSDNNIGKIYEPKGNCFEEVVENLVSILTDRKNKERIIVNGEDLLKYPLKIDINNPSLNSVIKLKNLNRVTALSPNILWITKIHDIAAGFESKPSPIGNLYYLNENERVDGGSMLQYRCNSILVFKERNSDKEVDVTLVKHLKSDNVGTTWVLNKDFNEVK